MRKFICIIIMALVAGFPTFAQQSEIQEVISEQMEAFDRDDFPRAFSFASPNVKMVFGTAVRFEVMVKRGYPMVYKKRSFKFGDLKEANGIFFQLVKVVDDRGVEFLLGYAMMLSEKGWKIDGVQLIQTNSVET